MGKDLSQLRLGDSEIESPPLPLFITLIEECRTMDCSFDFYRAGLGHEDNWRVIHDKLKACSAGSECNWLQHTRAGLAGSLHARIAAVLRLNLSDPELMRRAIKELPLPDDLLSDLCYFFGLQLKPVSLEEFYGHIIGISQLFCGQTEGVSPTNYHLVLSNFFGHEEQS